MIFPSLTNLNTGLNGDFSGISAPSVNNVWVCGGNRIYYYNGTDFTSQTAPPGTFNDIHFINNQKGWVVGDGGRIGYTTDGGASWNTQTNPDTQNRSLYGVFFLDSDNGWAIGSGEDFEDKDFQDHIESKALYNILEKEVIPKFYNRGSDGVPKDWAKLINSA